MGKSLLVTLSRPRPRYTATSRGELIRGTEEIAQRVHKERSYRSVYV